MAVDFLQRHLPEIDKSITAQKNAKGILPSLSTIRSKVKEHILQNALEKAEPIREPAKAKVEESKSIHRDQEMAKGISSEDAKTIISEKKSSNGAEDKTETDKYEESGRGTTTENEIQSNRSSVSRQSTTENESGLKKETTPENQEPEIEGQKEVKDSETILKELLSTFSKESLDYGYIVISSLMT